MGSMLITIFQAAPIGSMDPSWVDELMSVTSTASDLRAPALHAPPGETRPQNGGRAAGRGRGMRLVEPWTKIEVENGHGPFSIEKWCFSSSMLVYRRVTSNHQQSLHPSTFSRKFQRNPETVAAFPRLPSRARRVPPLVQGERSLEGLQDTFISTENGADLAGGTSDDGDSSSQLWIDKLWSCRLRWSLDDLVWLVVEPTPLKNMSSPVGSMKFPIYGKS